MPESDPESPESDPESDEVPAEIPNRSIRGLSAILLPHTAAGEFDWPAFEAHVARTVQAGLTPAVNMDTGFVQILDASTRRRVLEITAANAGEFVAGAFVADRPGASFDLGAYVGAADEIAQHGGTPVVFPSHGLNEQSDAEIGESLASIGGEVDRFIGFELGEMFVPYGRIYSLDLYEELLSIESCVGAKHSSLSRLLEWQRLAVRNRVRPGFGVFTGNDLAIDMVKWGSDYLLGLSTFAPAEFALRDRYWADGDPRFYELNDLLQYLGAFAFRAPTPGYRHDAAMFFELRGWAQSSEVPVGAPRRPDTDREVLADILQRLREVPA